MNKVLFILFTFLAVGKVKAFSPSLLETKHGVGNKLCILNAIADPPMMPAESQEEEHIQMEGDKRWNGRIISKIKNKARRGGKIVQQVDNIIDYKQVVVEEKVKVVVVRFYATWCRSCRATEPMFNRLVSSSSSNVKFVEVPITKANAYLHEGLGVPSFPYAHVSKNSLTFVRFTSMLFNSLTSLFLEKIYHPEAGLVEELKISKPHFAKFSQVLQSYMTGYCDVTYQNDGEETDTMGAFE